MQCRVSSSQRGFDDTLGVTRNISRSGLLILFENESSTLPVGVGDPVHIVLDLPESRHLTPRCLDCMATAVRVERPAEGAFEIAFQIVRTKVRDRKEKSRPVNEFSAKPAGYRYVQ